MRNLTGGWGWRSANWWALCALFAACGSRGGAPAAPTWEAGDARVSQQPFGVAPDGTDVTQFTLDNGRGMEVRLINYGGIITSIRLSDAAGEWVDVAPGFESLEQYRSRPFFSSLIGRYANRIAGGQFELEGTTHQLAVNNPPNHLHGGPRGFHTVVWTARPLEGEAGPGVELRYTSADGEEGYPGTLDVTVAFTLTPQNELVLRYRAEADRPTPVNLTHHVYFNLTGDAEREIFDHELTLYASHMTPVDPTLIPTGDIVPVAGTPFDFTTPRRLGARIDDPHPQLGYGGGYDHNWVLDSSASGGEPSLAARLEDPESGRVLELLTDKPGIQIYTGQRTAVALETQYFPDSPNQPDFPGAILRPGEVYESTTVYRFPTPSL